MEDKMISLNKNQTWKLIDKPKGIKVIGCKWVSKYKPGIQGIGAPRFKARLVAKEFSKIEVIDYDEVFSPSAKHTPIRLMLNLTAIKDLELE